MDSLESIKARYPGRPNLDFLLAVQGFYRKQLEEAKGDLRTKKQDCKSPKQNCSQVLPLRVQSLSALMIAFGHVIKAARDGRYGDCDVCKSEIPTDRLREVPQTTHCTMCAETVQPFYKVRKFHGWSGSPNSEFDDQVGI